MRTFELFWSTAVSDAVTHTKSAFTDTFPGDSFSDLITLICNIWVKPKQCPALILLVINSINIPNSSLFCPWWYLVSDMFLGHYLNLWTLYIFSSLSSCEGKWESDFGAWHPGRVNPHISVNVVKLYITSFIFARLSSSILEVMFKSPWESDEHCTLSIRQWISFNQKGKVSYIRVFAV